MTEGMDFARIHRGSVLVPDEAAAFVVSAKRFTESTKLCDTFVKAERARRHRRRPPDRQTGRRRQQPLLTSDAVHFTHRSVASSSSGGPSVIILLLCISQQADGLQRALVRKAGGDQRRICRVLLETSASRNLTDCGAPSDL